MLEQSGLHLGSFPETPFRLREWTVKGSHCVLDKTPDRMLDIQVDICIQQPCAYQASDLFMRKMRSSCWTASDVLLPVHAGPLNSFAESDAVRSYRRCVLVSHRKAARLWDREGCLLVGPCRKWCAARPGGSQPADR